MDLRGGGGELNTGWSGQQDWDLASDLSNFLQRIEISKVCKTIIKCYYVKNFMFTAFLRLIQNSTLISYIFISNYFASNFVNHIKKVAFN